MVAHKSPKRRLYVTLKQQTRNDDLLESLIRLQPLKLMAGLKLGNAESSEHRKAEKRKKSIMWKIFIEWNFR